MEAEYWEILAKEIKEEDLSEPSSDMEEFFPTVKKSKPPKRVPKKKKVGKKRIPAAVKRLVWNKYLGERKGKAKCYSCRVTEITQLSFHCGHVVSEKDKGKTTLANLRPICQNCNSSMGTKNMMDFIQEYGLWESGI